MNDNHMSEMIDVQNNNEFWHNAKKYSSWSKYEYSIVSPDAVSVLVVALLSLT